VLAVLGGLFNSNDGTLLLLVESLLLRHGGAASMPLVVGSMLQAPILLHFVATPVQLKGPAPVQSPEAMVEYCRRLCH
jgi:hypothetical protein